MLLIPVGHDQSIRRFPWLTAAIMTACVVLQVHRALLPDRSAELASLEARVEARMRELRRPPNPPASLEEAARADPQLAALVDEAEAIARRDPAVRFGYRPDQPYSYTATSELPRSSKRGPVFRAAADASAPRARPSSTSTADRAPPPSR